MLTSFKFGLMLGFSLIISIGAQNLFVIKQGLRKEYPYLCALICFLCDFGMILLGATGVNIIILEFPKLKILMLLLGAGFLAYYGMNGIKQGFNLESINNNLQKLNQGSANTTPSKLILLALTFSLLNPQALLDTLIIIGGNANHYDTKLKYLFILGTITANFIWFFGLALVSNFFSSKLLNAKFWRGLEFASGIIMISFAILFLFNLAY